jgi:hypothetical protein
MAEAMMAPHRVFDAVSLQIPRMKPAELGFIRSVAYLFVLYYEVGNIGVPYLIGLWDAFGLDTDRQVRGHREHVRLLRTFLQHNLSPRSSADRQTRESCQRWFAENCNTFLPSSENHWSACLHGLLAEAAIFLQCLSECLRAIEVDEGRAGILDRWLFSINRNHPPEAFDRIIEQAASDLGRRYIDAPRLRKRYYDRWVEKLSFLSPDYDFEVEARRLIEYALLVDIGAGLPITGQDIIAEFGIEPGPAVGSILERARRIFEESPVDRNGLLAALRKNEQVDGLPTGQPEDYSERQVSQSDESVPAFTGSEVAEPK